ncbi:hypothetical protein BC937DRAFT_93037, partial [Endogone sp. FLAS-F59071]
MLYTILRAVVAIFGGKRMRSPTLTLRALEHDAITTTISTSDLIFTPLPKIPKLSISITRNSILCNHLRTPIKRKVESRCSWPGQEGL